MTMHALYANQASGSPEAFGPNFAVVHDGASAAESPLQPPEVDFSVDPVRMAQAGGAEKYHFLTKLPPPLVDPTPYLWDQGAELVVAYRRPEGTALQHLEISMDGPASRTIGQRAGLPLARLVGLHDETWCIYPDRSPGISQRTWYTALEVCEVINSMNNVVRVTYVGEQFRSALLSPGIPYEAPERPPTLTGQFPRRLNPLQ
jgi:hypothetical protein